MTHYVIPNCTTCPACTACTTGMKHYLIHTPLERDPYYTNFPFFAADFKRWGYRVDEYPPSSLWIKEHLRKTQLRIRPLLLWASEVITRDEQQSSSREEGDTDSVGSVLADFIRGLVRFGEYEERYGSSAEQEPKAHAVCATVVHHPSYTTTNTPPQTNQPTNTVSTPPPNTPPLPSHSPFLP